MRNLELVDGDVDFLSGIRLIFSHGHTQGGQSVELNTEKGWYVVTGFCEIKYNFYPPEEIKKAIGYPIIPATVHSDSTQAYESSLKLLNMFGDKILPSHEQELMKAEEILGNWTGF